MKGFAKGNTIRKGIKPWNYGLKAKDDPRLELSNGRTLCLDCHKKTPNYARPVQ